MLPQAVGLNSSNFSHGKWLSLRGVQPAGCLNEVWRPYDFQFQNIGNIVKTTLSR